MSRIKKAKWGRRWEGAQAEKSERGEHMAYSETKQENGNVGIRV